MRIRLIKGLSGKSSVVESLCLGEDGILLDFERVVNWNPKIFCIVSTLDELVSIAVLTDEQAFNEIDIRIQWVLNNIPNSVTVSKNFFIYGFFSPDQIEVFRRISDKYDDYKFTFTIQSKQEDSKDNQIIIEMIN